MPDKIDQLFDDLQSRGYAKDKTRKQFRDYMLAPGKQGYENRKTFFEDFKTNGETDLGSYEDFKGLLGLHAVKKQTQPPTVYQKARQKSAPAPSKPQPLAQVEAPEGFGALNMRDAATAGFMRGQNDDVQELRPETAVEKQDRILKGKGTKEETKRVQKALGQRMDEMEYEKATGKRLRNAAMPESTIFAPTVERDENWEMVLGENGEPLVGMTSDVDRAAAHQQVVKEQENYKSIDDQLEEAYAEEERIKNLMKNDKKGREAMENLIMSGGYDPSDNPILDERGAYYNSLRQIERRIKELKAARDNGGFFRGTANVLSDSSTYSFGLTDLEDAKQLKKIKNKIDEAERKGVKPELTEGEQTFVDNYLKNEEAKQLNSDKWWYQQGQGFGQTLSFMKDFALTGGGFASAATKGLSLGSRLGKAAAGELLGAYMTKNLGTKALGKAIEYTGKGLGLVAGTEAGGFLLSNTGQIASTAADILNRQTGQVTKNGDGEISFEGGESLGKAALFGELGKTGENASELFGLGFDAVPKILGKVIQRTTTGKILKQFTNNKFWKTGEKGLNYLGVQSVWGEGMEEEYGMLRTEVLNNLTKGEFDPNGSGLFDLDRQLDTWASVGLTSMLLRVPSMVASGTKTANYYANQYNLNTSDRNMREVFDDTGRYESVKGMIDNAENNQLGGVLSNIMKNGQLSQQEKEAAFLYANDLVKVRGFNIGNVVAAVNGYQEPPRVANYNIKGLHVDAVDKDGNVLESYDYENPEELKAGLYEMQQKRADESLQSDMSVMRARPNNQFF
jgi:hypothetical protein